MHDRRDTPLRVAMEGLLAGVVGALGVMVMVEVAPDHLIVPQCGQVAGAGPVTRTAAARGGPIR